MTTSTKWAIAGVAAFAIILAAGAAVRQGNEALGLVARADHTVALTRGTVNAVGGIASLHVVDNRGFLMWTIPLGGDAFGLEMDPYDSRKAYVLLFYGVGLYRIDAMDVSSGAVLSSVPLPGLLNSPGAQIADMEMSPDGSTMVITTVDYPSPTIGAWIAYIVNLPTGLVTPTLLVQSSNVGGVGLAGQVAISPDATKAAINVWSSQQNMMATYVVSLAPGSVGAVLGSATGPAGAMLSDVQATNQAAYTAYQQPGTGIIIRKIDFATMQPADYVGGGAFPTTNPWANAVSFDEQRQALLVSGLTPPSFSTVTHTFGCLAPFAAGVSGAPEGGNAPSGGIRYLIGTAFGVPPPETVYAIDAATCAVRGTSPVVGTAFVTSGAPMWASTVDRRYYVYVSQPSSSQPSQFALNFVDAKSAFATVSRMLPSGTLQVLDLETSLRTPHRKSY